MSSLPEHSTTSDGPAPVKDEPSHKKIESSLRRFSRLVRSSIDGPLADLPQLPDPQDDQCT